MRKQNFCKSTVKEFETTVRNMGNEDIDLHLRTYVVMDDWQWADPMYRKWRRCVIIEGLKRGLISQDPGMNPILF